MIKCKAEQAKFVQNLIHAKDLSSHVCCYDVDQSGDNKQHSNLHDLSTRECPDIRQKAEMMPFRI